MKLKFEYIWLDGYTPEPNLRSKTRIINLDSETDPTIDDLPSWTFDGSSTKQAIGNKSDCIFQPYSLAVLQTKRCQVEGDLQFRSMYRTESHFQGRLAPFALRFFHLSHT